MLMSKPTLAAIAGDSVGKVIYQDGAGELKNVKQQ